MTMSIASCCETRLLRWGSAQLTLRAPFDVMARIEQLFDPWVLFENPSRDPAPAVRVEVVGHESADFDRSDVRPIRLHAALDGLCQSQDDRLLVRNETIDAWYELATGVVRLIYPGSPDVFDVSQVLRSALVEAGVRTGGQLVHTAVVVLDGLSLMLTGPKGAGKTSSLLAFLRAGAVFVSNDKALLCGREAIGVPQAISASRWVRDSLGGYPRHRSARSVGGKELFFPCEMDPPPATAGSARIDALVQVQVRAGVPISLRPATAAEIDAAPRYIAEFDNEVHGAWVEDLFATPQSNADQLARLDVPRLHLSFDPWDSTQIGACLAELSLQAATMASSRRNGHVHLPPHKELLGGCMPASSLRLSSAWACQAVAAAVSLRESPRSVRRQRI
jgi:hypothetical protein